LQGNFILDGNLHMNEYLVVAWNLKNKPQCSYVLTKDNQTQISKPPIKISIARIFYSPYPLEELGMRGGHINGWL